MGSSRTVQEKIAKGVPKAIEQRGEWYSMWKVGKAGGGAAVRPQSRWAWRGGAPRRDACCSS